MIVRMPIRRSSANRSRSPGFTVSFSSMTPRTSRVAAHGQRRCARGRDAVRDLAQEGRRLAVEVGGDRVDGSLLVPNAVGDDSAGARLGAERGRLGDRASAYGRRPRRSPPGASSSASRLRAKLDDRATLGRLVADRGQQGGAHDLGLADAVDRRDAGGQPIAEGDRAGLVEQDDVHVAARLHRAPDSASTLKRATRSMPAIPMADSSPPIVVGMRHTSSATSTTTPSVAPAYAPNGRSVATASRKTRVRPESRIESAISFGVRCRFAPSTSAIMRSRNVSPGSALIRMTSSSLTSCVPPVTRAADVGARLLEDGGGLARDGRLVDVRHALDDVAVAGNDLAGPDHDDVAATQSRRTDLLEAAVRDGGGRVVSERVRRRRRRLCPPASLGDRFGVGGEQDREPQPQRDLELEADLPAEVADVAADVEQRRARAGR